MKKTMLAFMLFFALLFSMPASAAAGKLTADAPTAKVGEQAVVRVHLDNPGIIDTRIFISYDSKVLRLDSAENGDVFAESRALFGGDLTANPYTMLWDDSLNPVNNTKSGTLFVLKFTVKSGTADGKTTVTVQVDDSSTFDTHLNAVSIAGCSTVVHVPVSSAPTTTKPTTTNPTTTKPTTTKPTTTKPTTTKPTTTKPTTTKPTTTKPTTTKPTTTKPTTAAKPNVTATVPATVTTLPQAVPAPTEAINPPPTTTKEHTTDAETVTLAPLTALTETPTADDTTNVGSTESAQIASEVQNSGSHLKLLWLLALLPVAALLVVLVKKKKH